MDAFCVLFKHIIRIYGAYHPKTDSGGSVRIRPVWLRQLAAFCHATLRISAGAKLTRCDEQKLHLRNCHGIAKGHDEYENYAAKPLPLEIPDCRFKCRIKPFGNEWKHEKVCPNRPSATTEGCTVAVADGPAAQAEPPAALVPEVPLAGHDSRIEPPGEFWEPYRQYCLQSVKELTYTHYRRRLAVFFKFLAKKDSLFDPDRLFCLSNPRKWMVLPGSTEYVNILTSDSTLHLFFCAFAKLVERIRDRLMFVAGACCKNLTPLLHR